MRNAFRIAAMVLGSCSAGLAMGQGAIWYVDDDAAPGGNGQSWALAFDTLDAGLAAAQAGDEVWVATGVYFPHTRVDPGNLSNPLTDAADATFFMQQGRKVYGGFLGNEATLAERAGLFNQTILTGDIPLVNGTMASARHVVFYFSEGYGPRGRLDGFVVRNGKAGQGKSFGGGGVLAGDTDGADASGRIWSVSLDIVNCRLENNTSESFGGAVLINGPLHMTDSVVVGNTSAGSGGGVATRIFGSNTRLINCLFLDNTAGTTGGGFSSSSGGSGSNPDVINCQFIGNAAGTFGGGIYFAPNGNSQPMEITNTLIAQNTATLGGGVYQQGGIRIGSNGTIAASTAQYANCTIVDNLATTEGGGLYLASNSEGDLRASAQVYNAIVWGNDAPLSRQLSDGAFAWFSDIEGGWSTGVQNIDLDPQFVNPAMDNYRLSYRSPLIDSSSSYFAPLDEFDLDGDGNTSELIPFDNDGRPRFYDVRAVMDQGSGSITYMDYGAFETQPGRVAPVRSATGGGGTYSR